MFFVSMISNSDACKLIHHAYKSESVAIGDQASVDEERMS